MFQKVSTSRQYLFTCLVIGASALVCFSLSDVIGYKVTAFVLFLTVSLIATVFDILPVLLAAVLSALIWDFFFIPPHFTFLVSSTEDMLLLMSYFVVALINAVLTFKIRQAEKDARQKEEKANTVKLYNILLNSLSHELRTPIATIIGASDNLLNEDYPIAEQDKHELLSAISNAALRLNEQVDNLLNMSRLESGFIQVKKDWCDISELIYDSLKQLDELLTQHHIALTIPDNLPLFKLDYGLMQQVLINLIRNAALYTPAQSRINISASYQASHLVIAIADNGKGFPEEEIAYVFDKFYRVKNSKTGGTGLGLSIAKGFTEAHGGHIQLSNKPEGGALFTIQIPVETSFLNHLKHE